mmetsp:Transcript_1043/g.2253  ORF Transcript_1043/g.2253 Transcript_1043/m.2253 type:complete len:788 (-) Transcript_1043:158-2521(-)|eukprot:CAMPEP_0194309030 /NCGR_PEP_ID=MMETSP0171-20130528/5996_1 /TAXON_ID=218684 /ORGANISM="Corethron pennatum, Strain L29A3" /LENGTH=787 /DNA_ID=CAMNT_0039061989 /DNA_START=457 /DNA_END=2820 /DNA_ORIENTATION=-
MASAAPTHAELRVRFEDFLRSDRFGYDKRIDAAVGLHAANSRTPSSGGPSSQRAPRFVLDVGDLRRSDPPLAGGLVRAPLPHIRALEAAAHELASELHPGYDSKRSGSKIRCAVDGTLGGGLHVSPRGLCSATLRRLVALEGVVTKCSAVLPKLRRSVHYCPATGQRDARDYVDAADAELGLPALDASGVEVPDKYVQATGGSYPTQDANGNPLETEHGLSEYADHQRVTVQEMPERAPVGQLPRSVDVLVGSDLVDRCKPGDRIRVVGVHRPLATANGATASGIFKTVVLGNHLRMLGKDASSRTGQFTVDDLREIKQIGARSDVLDLLGRSAAPSIYGHRQIKRALVLQLLGGCGRDLDNGTHLRGDINILMVGDPSTAKSQILRTALKVAPLAISTTGRGSSGVGLTAAVTTCPETGERRLEAGAMVLADGGMVCIDEFDKMGEEDRVAIHEVMEQQTVTIAKAGIHASLNARCSVLAAANPVYGQYDKRRRPQENIGLPDSLLSRFDLLFVVLDMLDPGNDRKIAGHVLRGHRYRRPGTGVAPETFAGDDSDYDEEEENNGRRGKVWDRPRSGDDASDDQDEVLRQDFLKKYVHYAKSRVRPVLTDAAREAIATHYTDMRSRMDERTLPITARSLETVIRLSTAHARARLSRIVEAEPDVSAAMEILSFALYHENKNSSDVKSAPASETTPSHDKEKQQEDAGQNPAKKSRIDKDAPDPQEKDDRDGGGPESIKTRIIRALEEATDGELDLTTVLTDLDDETKLREAQGLEDTYLHGNVLYHL